MTHFKTKPHLAYVWVLLGLMTYLSFNQAMAEPLEQATMTLNPEQCIAMQQGQDCYVTVEINWQSAALLDVCLYANHTQQALFCWQNAQQGAFKQELKTNQNVDFALRSNNNSTPLATSQLKIAWVHKKKGKPRLSWRLF
ncbi:DUF3019 domain-containing protein [Pseudoalteromonas tunicata]|uniref:DUF3019 domain-containing protein n=1 Tax=Pseudoalteromonas tunicata TaxID=314281 RepID=UPI00273E46EE|nr:DUF3019 domain-containing protein [Pseudoalteromonas tunicata]MDP5215100.1 DUF3019 domain-containing protein [Pseudoalteromonas tunicata]